MGELQFALAFGLTSSGLILLGLYAWPDVLALWRRKATR